MWTITPLSPRKKNDVRLGCSFFFQRSLFSFNLNAFLLHVQANMRVKTHVEVCSPHQGKQRDQVSTPTRQEQLKMSEPQEHDCNIVTEAKFTGQQVESFAPNRGRGLARLAFCELLQLAEQFLVRNCPADGRDRRGQ